MCQCIIEHAQWPRSNSWTTQYCDMFNWTHQLNTYLSNTYLSPIAHVQPSINVRLKNCEFSGWTCSITHNWTCTKIQSRNWVHPSDWTRLFQLNTFNWSCLHLSNCGCRLSIDRSIQLVSYPRPPLPPCPLRIYAGTPTKICMTWISAGLSQCDTTQL